MYLNIFVKLYSACIRILSVPKFVSVLSIWPACFSNTLSLCIFTWESKTTIKKSDFLHNTIQCCAIQKHILHTSPPLQTELQAFERPHFSFPQTPEFHLFHLSLLSFSTTTYLIVPFCPFFRYLSLPLCQAPQGTLRVTPGHRHQSSWATLNCLLMGVFLLYSYLIHVLRVW